MKRMRAILSGVLAALMLAGCGGVERVACQSERPSPDMNLTQYTVVEAAYPVFPKEPVYGDYIDDNGEGDWDAYFAAQEAYREELRQMGKGENVDDGAVLDFAGRTAAEIFAGQENTVYSPISLYVALGMLTELTDGETKRQVMALLDAADTWEPGFLEEIAAMIAEFPGCGVYSTAFNIVSHDGRFPARTPSERGVVANFFRDSAHRYISIPSASAVPRAVFEAVGGFPEGMKIGGDMYMWIKIARRYAVCFSPKPLANYSKVASNRSASSYTPERTRYSFEELYDPSAPEEYNEFVARAALGKALIISAKGGTKEAARAAEFFGYTKTYRRTLRKVRVLNALPRSWRAPLIGLYNSLAWRIARKGL